MYTILVDNLQTDFGKSLVRSYESSNVNAQTIYKALRERMEASTIGIIKSTELLAQITGARMKDARWNGTKEGYVIAWRDKIRQYDSLVDPSMVLTEPLKLVLLKNLVEGIPDLENLKTQDSIHISGGLQPMNFDSFLSLVEQIAATINRKVTGSRAAAIRPSLQGNEHNMYRSEDRLVHMQELQTLTDHGHGRSDQSTRAVC